MTDEDTRSKARKDKGPSTPEPAAQSDDLKNHKREALKDCIRRQVLHDLGEPADLLRVQVRPLWGAYYRVNVFVGVDAACARIPHSYFVVADGDGNVLDSTPKVRRQY